jgi:hypothetical protein
MARREVESLMSDDEVEKRATDALRRALVTPYKPQSALKLGKKTQAGAGRAKRKSPKST